MAALSSTLRGLALLTLCLVSLSAGVQAFSQSDTASGDSVQSNPRVLILGGGVAGIIAARTLHQNGLENFLIIEARDEIGGRLRSHTFGNGTTIELGANWVQGTQVGHGPSNPIWDLARKHNVSTVFNDYSSITTYDGAGLVNYTNIVDDATDNLDKITELAGERVTSNLIDLNARAGYSLVGAKPQSSHAKAAEYWNFDWEYGDTPSGSSLIAAGLNNNFTFDTDQGGFSDENRLSIDQRGFKTIITEEANGFLRPSQLLLNSTVKRIKYSHSGVQVTLANGTSITGDYVLCTFSLGVLQNDDVIFDPVLPDWKMEAIQSMTMTTYTKIFLQFPHKFWFNTEMGLYADDERGRYPVWQSLDHPKFLDGSGILFATVTGQYSERIEALPDRQVQSEVMDILRSMFPDTNVPSPSDFFFPRWHSDPLYRGSYSNWPASFTREHHDNLRASVGVGGRERLWFAGEATSFKYFGFLHGAYTEAVSVTQEMIRCIRRGQCTGLGHFDEVRNVRPYDTIWIRGARRR
ncbi:FAD/NAD(P)-binding domain superfamily protein [Pleurotus pulmonarius]